MSSRNRLSFSISSIYQRDWLKEFFLVFVFLSKHYTMFFFSSSIGMCRVFCDVFLATLAFLQWHQKPFRFSFLAIFCSFINCFYVATTPWRTQPRISDFFPRLLVGLLCLCYFVDLWQFSIFIRWLFVACNQTRKDQTKMILLKAQVLSIH